ncbi:hypothetical protein [Deinococcus sp. Arct2-2]|uniref:hypothetical protein n=1 Tax=Deinococcus sp. Arct2-2 TaxID=2568653 RepID=UPI001454D58E|nr:hypothetical protein [Deinococcus sp. Arct2-2]
MASPVEHRLLEQAAVSLPRVAARFVQQMKAGSDSVEIQATPGAVLWEKTTLMWPV